MTRDEINNCSAKALGYLFGILAHEILHGLCPRHSGSSTELGDDPPTVPPPPPDCNDLNYARLSAQAACAMIGKIIACRADPCVTNPLCPPMRDNNGNQIPGLTTTQEVDAFCQGLQQFYKDLQDRFNTPDAAQAAYDCACSGDDSWPPSAFTACPDSFESLHSKCPDGVQGMFPGNKVIPDCAQCPSCN